MVNLIEILTLSAILLFVILIILVLVWAIIPPKRRHRPEVKEDLKKIKKQINDD